MKFSPAPGTLSVSSSSRTPATMETEWRDLDIDSLELVELVTALEDRFDVKIADGELKSISGVGDAVRLTVSLANEPASA